MKPEPKTPANGSDPLPRDVSRGTGPFRPAQDTGASPPVRRSGPLTVGALGKRCGLSRSTLLYYDRIGLLRPSGRSEGNYRTYSPEDVRKLDLICRYRTMGLPLEEVGRLLKDGSSGRLTEVLQNRLAELDEEIVRIREQQRVIVRLLQADSRTAPGTPLDKEGWIALLRAAGLDEDGMQKWHQEFERNYPGSHQSFLEGLGIPVEEIARIREFSRQ